MNNLAQITIRDPLIYELAAFLANFEAFLVYSSFLFAIIGFLGIIILNTGFIFPIIDELKQEDPKTTRTLVLGFLTLFFTGLMILFLLNPLVSKLVILAPFPANMAVFLLYLIPAILFLPARPNRPLAEKTLKAAIEAEKGRENSDRTDISSLLASLKRLTHTDETVSIEEMSELLENLIRFTHPGTNQKTLEKLIEQLRNFTEAKKNYEEEMTIYDSKPKPSFQLSGIQLSDLLDADGELKIYSLDEENQEKFTNPTAKQ